MAKQKDETGKENVMVGAPASFPRMLSLEQVQEIESGDAVNLCAG